MAGMNTGKTLIVLKRDGRKERFLPSKLYLSIRKAAEPVGLGEDEIDKLFATVRKEVEEAGNEVPSWRIADIVARNMVERGVYKPEWFEAAKRYELARIYKDVYGKNGWKEFNEDDLNFSFNALKVMEARYLIKDPESWRFKETPSMMFRRVARFLAKVEEAYGASPSKVKDIEEKFYELMVSRRFMPNSPTLMNAGTKLGILSACFVVPISDAMSTPEGEGIMDALRAQALIHQAGGGTGFDFSELRPEGDVVGSSGGVSSGPLSFMKLFDVATDVVKQGGKRRGANMGIMHIWHPDIEKFILSKSGQLKDVNLQNFNISVGMYDEFMRAVEAGKAWPLINPRKTDLTGLRDSRYYAVVRARHYMDEEWVQEVILKELEEKGGSVPLEESVLVTWDEAVAIAEEQGAIVKWVDARELFGKIVQSAWDSGDPGMIFFDEINRRHPVWYLGKIHATNPCGEEPLLDWENCNLGSINLEMYVVETSEGPVIDWERLARDVRIAVRLLDNVIDANRHPLPQITEANKLTRKIGLGVMGWARMLVRLGIPYDSPDAIYLAWYVAEWIAWNAYDEGVKLAREKGPFPAWDPSKYRWLHETIPFKSPGEILKTAGLESEPSEEVKRILERRPPVDWNDLKKRALKHGLRNATYLSIAPTGSISIIAGTSASIEPLFALAYVRRVAVGTFIEVDPLFLSELRKLEMDEPEVIEEIAETGSIAHLKWIPRRLRRIFKTAHDIDPEWHLVHQAAWQVWVDAAVSKTINLRHDEPPETVERVYKLAWKLRLKGITVYRDRSKSRQVIYFGIKKKEAKAEESKESGHEGLEEAGIAGEKPVLVIKPQLIENKERSLPGARSATEASSNIEAQSVSAESKSTGEEANTDNRMAPKVSRVRLGKGKIKELVTVSAEYAGGCPTCDI